MQAERLAERASSLLNIELNATQLEQLAAYETEMLQWNDERTNLTAITDPDEVEVRHFLDSMSILAFVEVEQGSKVADIGTGAGLPGLVLKIVRPDIELLLVESVGKKAEFLQYMADTLRLSNVQVLNERAEEAGQMPGYREQYDLVVARSVAAMPSLAEYMLPLCKVGGRCVAMKGGTAIKEVDEGTFAIEVLGGRFSQMFTVNLPDMDTLHILVVIDKIEETTEKYPRRAGMPSKRPLLLKK